MEKTELYDIILSVKADLLDLYSNYFQKLRIGDANSTTNQVEYFRALDLYVQILEYYYNIWNDKDITLISEKDINNVIEAAVALIRTFKTTYYA